MFFIVLAYAVVRVARRPVEPFVSVSFDSQTFYGIPGISIEVSNRMSFNVNYWVESWNSPMESQRRIDNHNFSYSLFPHSQSREFVNPSDKAKIRVSYERQLKSFEVSFLNRLPWLKQHYPFQSRRTNIYEWKETDK